MNENDNHWNDYPSSIPQARKQYRWRLPLLYDPGLFVTFIAWMRQRGAGYKDVYSPQFDYWDGYRVLVPTETQWQECEQVEGLADYGHTEICIEGAELAPCPFCGKIPKWYGSNRSHGGTLIGAAPHQFNTWRLECCAWAGTPSMSASWLIAERAKLLAATPTAKEA